jgi:alpha-beta hydrolase superfamily lysophospholipase
MTDIQAEPFELSSPDHHIVRGTLWLPPAKPLGVLQIFHGLGEYHSRYARFAGLATARGLAVVAHDHRGHGRHAEEQGHFANRGGWQSLTDDALLVNDMIGDRYPGLPIVLLGHSMGSFIAQFFSMQHGYRLSALVLSASTWPNKFEIIPGRLLARIESWRLGIRGKSKLLDKLGFGDFNKPFLPARTDHDWLSRDESEVDAYINDPLCGGPYSCGLWIDFLGGLQAIASDNELSRIQADLPILLTGGAEDPVGGQRGITELAMHYSKSGHTRLSTKIYPEGRHEMFNELNRDEFSADVLAWIEKQLPDVAGTQA